MKRTISSLLLPALLTMSACAAESSADAVSTQQLETVRRQETVSNGEVWGGRDGKSLDVQWIQWRDGTCSPPLNDDGTPWAGKASGAACRFASDCELSCNACGGSSARYLVAACLDHRCADSALAATIANEQQSRDAFAGRELCR